MLENPKVANDLVYNYRGKIKAQEMKRDGIQFT